MLKPNENSTATNEQQANTQTPAGTEGAGRTFTQEEVNRIVSERLQRERDKAGPSPADQREADLRARESKMDCREFVTEKGYPAGLLDILDTSDFERFRTSVEKLDKLLGLPSKERKLPIFTMPIGTGSNTDEIADAFRPKI